MSSPSYHVELSLYADNTAIKATYRNPTLLVSYLESYLNYLERLLIELRIAINISRSTMIIFARAVLDFIEPRPVSLLGLPIQWVHSTHYLGVTLDTRLNWSPHNFQVGKRTAQKMVTLVTA